jgi:hypothetical protein
VLVLTVALLRWHDERASRIPAASVNYMAASFRTEIKALRDTITDYRSRKCVYVRW